MNSKQQYLRAEVDAVVINGNYTYPTVSNNKFTITVPAVDFTLAVTFKNIIYTLSYVIDDGEHDVFTFQQNYIHNDPTPITDTYIVDETGVSDWTYNGNHLLLVAHIIIYKILP